MHQLLRQFERSPVFISVGISLFISSLLIFTNDLINSDGVLYIEAAKAILAGDWVGSLKLYSWPFYSLLIAVISKLTFLDAESSAYLINTFIHALLVFTFVRCVQALGGNNKVVMFAAVLILTNVTLQGYRDLISRDFGYWAFFFTALLFFIKYYHSEKRLHAFSFSFFMIIATLFRIEGVVFLLLAPLLILFRHKRFKENILSVVELLLPIIILLLITIIYVIFSGMDIKAMGRISDPLAFLQGAYQNLTVGIIEKGNIIEETILPVEAKDIGTKSMLAIFSMMLVIKIFSASGYIPLIFSVYAHRLKSIRKQIVGIEIVYGFIAINLLVLIVFVLDHGFLSPRYTMTVALLMMLIAAFGLSAFMAQIPQPSASKKLAQIVIIVMLSYMFLDGVTSFGASKQYIKTSGQWLSENMPKDARLGASSRRLYYYANKNIDSEAASLIDAGLRAPKVLEISAYDYLAVKINRKKLNYEKILTDRVGHKPDFRTSNERGDTVVIYKLR